MGADLEISLDPVRLIPIPSITIRPSVSDYEDTEMPHEAQKEFPFPGKSRGIVKSRKPKRRPSKEEARLRKVLEVFGYRVLKVHLKGGEGLVAISLPKS